MFSHLLALITEYANDGFFDAVEKLNSFITSTHGFLEVLAQIGTIPEAIAHDSTEEKLYAKVSDAVLARAFRELGLKSFIFNERADSADVFAQSPVHGYTLVADAKAFRLSRTAINQKDFKVGALSGWRNDADYAVLCSPYFRYPQEQSQIYAQSIDHNVCLLSWEHLIFLLRHGVRESRRMNLCTLWNFGESISHTTIVANNKECFIRDFDAHFLSTVGLSHQEFDDDISSCVDSIKSRGNAEKLYWEQERKSILAYSHEQAISELIKSRKIDEKIRQIDLYIRRIRRD